jgi:hypothetical protein
MFHYSLLLGKLLMCSRVEVSVQLSTFALAIGICI